jgi:hypothetical protein
MKYTYSYLKQTNMSFKNKQTNREQEAKQILSGRLVPAGVGEDIRRGCRRANIVEICIHVSKWKNETCGNYSRNGGGGQKRMMEVVNLTMIHCKNFCKCCNVPPVQ